MDLADFSTAKLIGLSAFVVLVLLIALRVLWMLLAWEPPAKRAERLARAMREQEEVEHVKRLLDERRARNP